uniref:Uncharacterized protein n=1 Tax=Romanomermis culicivorax TaxID=13658 RepID=A0A915HET5_ROMCU
MMESVVSHSNPMMLLIGENYDPIRRPTRHRKCDVTTTNTIIMLKFEMHLTPLLGLYYHNLAITCKRIIRYNATKQTLGMG